MSEIPRATVRRVARTTEYFIVGQIARKIPPAERFFLVFEIDSSKKQKKERHDPRVERAIKRHERGGYCIDACILATVTRAQLAVILGAPDWMDVNLSDRTRLESNQARCVLLSDDPRPPKVIVLTARAVNRPAPEETEEPSLPER
jgi:hypothetical protein